LRHYNTPTKKGFALIGATTGNETILGGAGTQISAPASIYILGNASGAQESAAMDLPIVRMPI